MVVRRSTTANMADVVVVAVKALAGSERIVNQEAIFF